MSASLINKKKVEKAYCSTRITEVENLLKIIIPFALVGYELIITNERVARESHIQRALME